MSTTTLPRKVFLSGPEWPAKTIVRIDRHRPCRHCGEQIAYYADRYLEGAWAHTGTESPICDLAVFKLAESRPSCPQCSGRNITFTQESWGNRTRCTECSYNHFSPIGD